ncbi:MAG: nuclear transport factor 2 family protein, partial [bacterium]
MRTASADDVRDAYEKYVHPDFFHHNICFKGDRETLLKGMEDNAPEFPGKNYEVQRALEGGDLVAVHGKIT